MHVRRAAIVALSLLLPLAAAGCGDDKDSADTTTTTTASSTTTEASGTQQTIAPTTTITQEEFDTQIAAFNTSLDKAGGDFCKTAAAANSLNPGMPSSPDQVKALYEAFAKELTAIADALPADSGIDPAKLKDAAQRVMDDGKAANFDPATLGSQPPPSLTAADVTATMQGVQQLIEKSCAPGQ